MGVKGQTCYLRNVGRYFWVLCGLVVVLVFGGFLIFKKYLHDTYTLTQALLCTLCNFLHRLEHRKQLLVYYPVL